MTSFRLSPADAADRLSALRHLQQEGILCDVILETERGEQVRAHRAVLAACSHFFRAMFSSNLAESTQKLVRLPDIEIDVLSAVVSYAYGGDVTLKPDQVLSLLAVSDRLQIHSLFADCGHVLQNCCLRPDNCLAIRAVAEMHGCTELSRICTEYVFDNFEDVLKHDEYLSLPCSQLKELISRDEIRVSSEERVYAAVMQWVQHDLADRKANLAEVMSLVRLPFVSQNFLTKVECEELVSSEAVCQSLIEEARLYKSSPEKRAHLRRSPRGRPRKPSGLQNVILAAGGMSKDRSVASVEQYCVRTDEWTALTDMTAPRYGHALCHVGGHLYVVGGYSERGGCLDLVERYNLRSNTWHSLAPLRTARRYHSIEVLYGLIYVTGGQSEKGVINLVECYDPERDLWTPGRPMCSPRMYHGSTVVDGLLLVAGGHDGFKRLNSTELFNPASQQWTALAPMMSPRSVAGMATMRGTVFVAGGYDGKHHLDSVEYYDIELDRWYLGPSMACPRSALGLVVYSESLYACGGFSGTITNSVEYLLPGKHKWEPAVGMNMARVHFGMTCT